MHESAKAVIGFYRRHANDFNAERSRALFEQGWLDRFATALPAGARILDLGCGMGEPIAHYLIERRCRLCGIDSSAEMISLSRARFPDHEWQVADMRDLALGRRFDGVLAWDSFFHLSPDDQRAMFMVFRDHAPPGACLMFTSGPAHGEAIGHLWGEALYHASLSVDEYRELLDAHGFAVMDFAVEDPDCDRHTVWLARRDEAR